MWYKKSSKKREIVISETQELLTEKEILLSEKEEQTAELQKESQQLKQKVNESFDEIVNLAKTNSPEFLTRFQEVYPDVIENLRKINPNLVMSEIRFCALLFLNFSTKDIAEYTFTSTRTVQNKKYRLRKKLGIDLEKDIYIWMKETMN